MVLELNQWIFVAESSECFECQNDTDFLNPVLMGCLDLRNERIAFWNLEHFIPGFAGLKCYALSCLNRTGPRMGQLARTGVGNRREKIQRCNSWLFRLFILSVVPDLLSVFDENEINSLLCSPPIFWNGPSFERADSWHTVSFTSQFNRLCHTWLNSPYHDVNICGLESRRCQRKHCEEFRQGFNIRYSNDAQSRNLWRLLKRKRRNWVGGVRQIIRQVRRNKSRICEKYPRNHPVLRLKYFYERVFPIIIAVDPSFMPKFELLEIPIVSPIVLNFRVLFQSECDTLYEFYGVRLKNEK